MADYYVTPTREVVKFLRAWQEDLGGVRFMRILDPCAGGDEKSGMSYPAALKETSFAPGAELLTVDVRGDSKAEIKADFLEWDGGGYGPDLIITNPPFVIAQDVIRKSLSLRPAYVVMLLRLNYFGSNKRLPFWRGHMPESVYVHSDRMNFVERLTVEECRALGMKNKGTDSIEYCHCVWKVGYSPRFTQMRVI